jgi:hypothetical protein
VCAVCLVDSRNWGARGYAPITASGYLRSLWAFSPFHFWIIISFNTRTQFSQPSELNNPSSLVTSVEHIRLVSECVQQKNIVWRAPSSLLSITTRFYKILIDGWISPDMGTLSMRYLFFSKIVLWLDSLKRIDRRKLLVSCRFPEVGSKVLAFLFLHR